MKYILLLVFIITSLFSQNLGIKSSIGYFEQVDDTQKLDITLQEFSPLIATKSNFGFKMSTYWLKVDVQNNSDKIKKEVLFFPYPSLDFIDIYELENKELLLKREYGDLRVFRNDGLIPDPSFIFTLKPQEAKTYYFRIKTQGVMNIQLVLNSDDEFHKHSIEKSIMTSLYFGAVFIMLIYNFLLYTYIKDRSYLYYIIFHVDYFVFLLALHGIGSTYFWNNTPFLNTFMIPLLMSIGSTLAVLFTIEFLNIKSSNPKLYKYLYILFWINVLVTLAGLLTSYHSSVLFTTLASLVSIVSIIYAGLHSHFLAKNPYAKIFTFAWGSLLLGIFIIHFRNLGILPYNLFTSYSPFFGAFLELTLLSIALAYRYNIQRQALNTKDNMLYKQSRLASMGEMISNISHQWRQPLNRVNLSLAVIKEVIQEKEIDKEFLALKIKNSEENIEYMSQTIEDFANFFAPNKKREAFSIYKTIDKALKLLESRVKDVTIHMPKDKNLELFGFENEYIQIILVILNNALDNFEIKNINQKDIYISIKNKEEIVSITITDNGGGIEKKDIEYIFDPYFTTKFKKEGTGIGLYMAKMLIENSMNGKLKVYSSNGETSFEIIHNNTRGGGVND